MSVGVCVFMLHCLLKKSRDKICRSDAEKIKGVHGKEWFWKNPPIKWRTLKKNVGGRTKARNVDNVV